MSVRVNQQYFGAAQMVMTFFHWYEVEKSLLLKIIRTREELTGLGLNKNRRVIPGAI
jgi:hypothetical protein